jgi:hypothetical protein
VKVFEIEGRRRRERQRERERGEDERKEGGGGLGMKTRTHLQGSGGKNNENTIRKRSVKTSKTMLPCRRGALLAKSACFKKTPDDIPIKHANDIQIHPKTINKPVQNVSQKWVAKIVARIFENTTGLAIYGSCFGAICISISRPGTFF